MADDKKYNRKYKDSLFRMVFREKENLLSLYNAVNSTDYAEVGELKIVTLENAIYMTMKNDVAFLLYDYINMYEHQSTINPNMPLRDLFYIAYEYEKLVDGKQIYGSKTIQIPTPRFIMFYNETETAEESVLLKLSDLYSVSLDEPELELKVKMLNINYGYNKELLKQCKILGDYSVYVHKVRSYAKEMPTEEAVDVAMEECIREGVLEEFLIKYRKEARMMSIFEYDEEQVMSMIREQIREEGLEQGRRQGLVIGAIEALRDFGHDDKEIKAVVMKKYSLSEEEITAYL